MKSNLQYHLKVENGEIQHEEGNFFRAIPFIIQHNNTQVKVNFTHQKHEVVYQLLENEKEIAVLRHPDYLPESSVKDSHQHIKSSISSQIIIEAFLQLKIGKSKEIVKELETLTATSYEIIQHSFTN